MKVELTHDILAAKIYDRVSTDEKTLRKVEKFIGDRYQFYEARGVLLGKDDIDYINPYLKNVDISKEEHEFIKKSKSALKRRQRFLIALAALIFLLISGSAIEAWRQRGLAIQNAEEARKQTEIAQIQRDSADIARQIAEEARQEAIRQKDSALVAQEREAEQRRIAQENERKAEIARINAVKARIEADTARARAVRAQALEAEQRAEAERQRLLAEENEREANRLLILSIAQSMAAKSLQIKDPELKSLVAQQAYKFNKSVDGPEYDKAIYSGLYYALKVLTTDSLNNLYGHTSSVRSLTFSKEGAMYSTGSDGNYLKWLNWLSEARVHDTIAQPWIRNAKQDTFLAQPQVNRPLIASPNRKWLAGGDDDGNFRIYNLENPQIGTDNSMQPQVLLALGPGRIWDLVFIPWQDAVYFSTDDRRLMKYNIQTEDTTTLLKTNSVIKSLSISQNGQMLAATTDRGKLYLWKKEGDNLKDVQLGIMVDKSDFMEAALSFDGKKLAVGDLQGMVFLIDLATQDVKRLPGHSARISSLAFDRETSQLASASYDGTIQLWHLSEDYLQALPLVLDDHQRGNFVTSIQFVSEQPYVVAGCYNGLIKLWPTQPELLSEVLCEFIRQKEIRNNFTNQEWKLYVGENETNNPQLDPGPVCEHDDHSH